MEKIEKQLKDNKPDLSHTSLRTYGYILKRLLKKLDIDVNDYQKLVEKQEEILKILENDTPQSRKTVLAVLISLFGSMKTDKLRVKMLEDANLYNSKLREQKKTEKQEANWMSWEQVQEVYNDVYKELNPLLRKKSPTQRDILRLVDLILLACFVLIPPRRSQDFTEMKVRNYNIDEDNYYDAKRNVFVFNRYKTRGTYGSQTVKVPPNLSTLLKRWIKVNTTDYLLFDTKKGKLTQSRLTLKMNSIFDKKISSSMLRHIFLSSKFGDGPTLKERDEIAQDMGHSVETQFHYTVK